YENLMVDLRATNVKLTERAERIIMTVTGISRDDAKKLLESAFGNAKVAIVMQKLGIDYTKAKKRLDVHDGFVRKVLNNS
ncbi:partial N-acetylmuramic acid 6-phosphate etherase, partial [Patescibacteria group bacterium]